MSIPMSIQPTDRQSAACPSHVSTAAYESPTCNKSDYISSLDLYVPHSRFQFNNTCAHATFACHNNRNQYVHIITLDHWHLSNAVMRQTDPVKVLPVLPAERRAA
jgi:hypothetical protein